MYILCTSICVFVYIILFVLCGCVYACVCESVSLYVCLCVFCAVCVRRAPVVCVYMNFGVCVWYE